MSPGTLQILIPLRVQSLCYGSRVSARLAGITHPSVFQRAVGEECLQKEREARQHQLGIVNPDDRSAYLVNGPGPSGVIVHQDAGPSEIPPSYDSLLSGPSRTGTPQGGSSS